MPSIPSSFLNLYYEILDPEHYGLDKNTKKNSNQVNPDILGGLIVDISGRTIDLSVSSRVAKMNNLLQEAL